MKTLYLECTSGISGDMTVAALLDLGADEATLRAGLGSLGVGGYRLEISRVKKSGIDACDFNVILEDDHHGQEHSHEHTHPHEHRNLGDILRIIEASAITPRARELAICIFEVVARAEARVHGLPVERVHFHEVGAVDSIVDIVGAAICVDNLGIGKVICSPLNEGTGTVRCRHGVMPVPAPATLEIVREHGIPLNITDNDGEMVTPTGAAIAAALAGKFGRPEGMTVAATGYGAGKREYKTANLLRAMLLEKAHPEGRDAALLLECNLDDMTGEHLGHAMGLLLEAGALDVWCTPVTMKKSRPGVILSVLCDPVREMEMLGLLFTHTSTAGVRRSLRERHVMTRSLREIETPYGPLTVKDCSWGDVEKTTVEYESARKISKTCKIPLDLVYRCAYNR